MNANIMKMQILLYKNVNIVKTQIFHKVKYDLKGHPKSQMTTFMPKYFLHICLWADFDENLYEC